MQHKTIIQCVQKCATIVSGVIIGILALAHFSPRLQAANLSHDRIVLNSASELDYPPFALVKPDGTADGFSVDLLKAAVAETGLAVSFKVGPWHQLKEELANGLLDVLPLVSYSSERAKIYDFTAPYLKLSGAVFVRKNTSAIRQISDLKGKEVLVMRGDTAHEYVEREKLTDMIVPTESYEEAFKLLSSGHHDAVVVQLIVGLQIIKKLQLNNVVAVEQKDISTLKPVAIKLEGFEQKFCFAVTKGNQQLLSALNEGLAVIYLNGTYQALYEKWFSPLLSKDKIPFSTIIKNLLVILIPLLLFLTLFGLWYLKRLVKQKTEFLEHEILDRKEAEDALRESEKRFRLAVASSPIPIMIHDESDAVLQLSNGWTNFSGYALEDIPTISDWMEKAYGERQGIKKDYIDNLFSINQSVSNGEWQITTKEGSTRVWDFQTTPLGKLHEGKRVLLSMAIDVTERKQAEETQKRLGGQLLQSQKMEAIGTLAGGIAHDFNNILGAILGYAELARDDCAVDSLAANDIDQVIIASNRAKDLIKQILVFSRHVEAELTPLQPALIIKETIKLLRPSLPATITIVDDIDPNSGFIIGDPTQIHQIVINLCTNAYQAMESTGGTITVSLPNITLSQTELKDGQDVTPGNFIQLAIRDTGPGISSSIIARIFEPYFTTKETGKGSGMGLAIVHGIVKGYGGFISCESQPGRGTEFRIFLPIQNKTYIDTTKPVEQTPVGTEHILFIDDEKLLAEMGQTMLTRLGYKVTVRTSSIEALTTFNNDPDAFDLVITDQTMPGMTGADLARRMLQIRPQLPIILCTGFSSQITEGKARTLGIKGFAFKPLAKKDISKLIRKILDDHRL